MLMGYLESNNILDEKQGGFRAGHSTIGTVSYFTDEIYRGLNDRDFTLSTFVDLKKAFDRVDRELLFNAMLKHGAPLHLVLMMIALYCESEITLELPDGTKIVVSERALAQEPWRVTVAVLAEEVCDDVRRLVHRNPVVRIDEVRKLIAPAVAFRSTTSTQSK